MYGDTSKVPYMCGGGRKYHDAMHGNNCHRIPGISNSLYKGKNTNHYGRSGHKYLKN